MKISKFGENALVDWLKGEFPSPSRTIVGIGDDCAVIPYTSKNVWLITTDALVEKVHFLKELISPQDIGYKLIMVNASDIAAMGGNPRYCFITAAIPSITESQWVKDLFYGISEACQENKISVLGGDITGSKNLIFLNVTMIGDAKKTQVKYRSGAKPDDLICVTGFLGDAAAGLKCLQKKIAKDKNISKLVQAHCRPLAHVQEGKWLGKKQSVHAMMDLSDGIHLDLTRILKECHLGAFLDLDRIPISRELKLTCEKYGWDCTQLALAGGEDYNLLVIIKEKDFEKIQGEFIKKFQKPLFQVGKITALDKKICYIKAGKYVNLEIKTFDHFKI